MDKELLNIFVSNLIIDLECILKPLHDIKDYKTLMSLVNNGISIKVFKSQLLMSLIQSKDKLIEFKRILNS